MPKFPVVRAEFANPISSGRALSHRNAKLVYDTDAQILAVEMKETSRKFIVPSDNIVLLEIVDDAKEIEALKDPPPAPPPPPAPAVDDTFRPAAKAPKAPKGGAK